MNNDRLNALLEAWALLTRRAEDLEVRVTALEGEVEFLKGQVMAQLREEAEARSLQ